MFGKTGILTLIWLKIAYKDEPTLDRHSTLVSRGSQTRFEHSEVFAKSLNFYKNLHHQTRGLLTLGLKLVTFARTDDKVKLKKGRVIQ